MNLDAVSSALELLNVLIIKLNACGDVVRTTTLLRRLPRVTWITAAPNSELLQNNGDKEIRCLEWANRERALDRAYDLVVNLEDDVSTATFAAQVRAERLFGAYLRDDGSVTYSEDSRQWFDLSLISVYGRRVADEMKMQNRRTYQQLIFEGLGLVFSGERYVLPPPVSTKMSGDVAIAPMAGAVWPMKGWAYYGQLKAELEGVGLKVNVLPRRKSLREHLGDVANHRCLVSGDSLPMHLALGTGTPCVTLFNCTSPWEIYDYGVQTKLVSPLLDQFFYKRGFDQAATTAIPLEEVFNSVMQRLKQPTAAVE